MKIMTLASILWAATAANAFGQDIICVSKKIYYPDAPHYGRTLYVRISDSKITTVETPRGPTIVYDITKSKPTAVGAIELEGSATILQGSFQVPRIQTCT